MMIIPDTDIKTETVVIEHANNRLVFDAVSGDHIASVLAGSKNFYEWQLLSFLGGYLNPGDFVIDVGANIGNHSLYFAKICGSDVLAYEPLAFTADILQRNVDQNFLDDQIEVRRKVLGESTTRAALQRFDARNVGATAFDLAPSGDYRVTSLDLERIRRKIVLIKVDAEGMDLSVLKGSIGLISRDRPVLVCEAATHEEQLELETFAAEISYAFVAEFNATPTFVLVPAGTPRELVAISHRSASLMTRTNLATRDLNYRLGLTNGEIRRVANHYASTSSVAELGSGLEEQIRELTIRVGQLQDVVDTFRARLEQGG